MNPTEINIAIAEACGQPCDNAYHEIVNPPNYYADLNAILPLLPAGTNILRCHEHWIVYFDGYTVSASHQDLAPAACEFYLKTLGKWKD